MMQHGLIVPSLMYTDDNCNPKIDFSSYRFSVPTKLVHWNRPSGFSRRACVNSFGFGGTNAHAIVTQFEESSSGEVNNGGDALTIVALSALDDRALKDNVQSFNESLEKGDVDLRALGYTSTCRREHRYSRVAFVVSTQQELESQCDKFLKLEPHEKNFGHSRRKVFVFCGVGTAWKGMCKELMSNEVFENQIREIDGILETYTGWRIGAKFESEEDVSADPLTSHIAIFACQLGIASLWKHYGLVPDAVTGQSVGEVAAAFVCGRLDLKNAVKVIYHRSYFLSKVTGGAMMVVKGYPTSRVVQVCDKLNGSASIAVFSSWEACTVSGTTDALESLKSKIKSDSEGQRCTFIDLNVQCAYHSKFVEIAKEQLINKLKDLEVAQQSIPLISTVTGTEADNSFATGHYWGRNVREPVKFQNAILNVASKDDQTVFIEVGPSPVLSSHMSTLFGNSKQTKAVASVKRARGLDVMYEAIATLFMEGEDFRWRNIVPHSKQLTPIPKYKFQKERRMLKSKTLEMKSQGLSERGLSHLYVERLPDKNGKYIFSAQINVDATPFMYEHVIRDNIIVPGAYYADIGFKIGKSLFDFVKDTSFVVSLNFRKPVRVEEDESLDLEVTAAVTEKDQKVIFKVKHVNDIVCKGTVCLSPVAETKRINIPALRTNLTMRLTSDEMYENLAKLGFQYGPSFCILKDCMRDDCRCLVELSVPESIERVMDQTYIHPCILDSMLQSCVNVMDEETLAMASGLTTFPLCIEGVNLLKKPLTKMLLYMKRVHQTVTDSMVKIHFNAALLEYDGEVIVEMTNYVVYGRRLSILSPDELKYQLEWLPMSKPVHRETKKQFNFVVCGLYENLQNLFDANKHIVVNFTGKDPNKAADELTETIQKSGKALDSVKAVIFVTQPDYGDITPEAAIAMDNFARQNCMCLRSLVMMFIDGGLKIPLYVVTENTQRSSGLQYSADVNLKGSELWGFVRSLQYEYIHTGGPLVLVDMSPSMTTCLVTFQRMVKADILAGTWRTPERLIVENRVRVARLVPSPRHEKLPSLMASNSASGISSQRSLQSSHANEVEDVFLLEDVYKPSTMNSDGSGKTVLLSLSRVCRHPAFLLPMTQTEAEGLADIWSDGEDKGHQILGIEYTGFEITKDSWLHMQNNLLPKQSKATSISKQPIVALYPSKIMSELCIPKQCTMKVSGIKNYVPGLLTTIVMLKALVDKIDDGNTVVIVAENVTSLHARLCVLMVQSRKQYKLVSMNNTGKKDVIDVAVVLDVVREERDVALPKVKRIICIKSTLSAYLQNNMFFGGLGTIVEVDPKTVFTKDNIVKTLPKIVAWYNKQSKSIYAGEHSSLAHSAMRSHAVLSLPLGRKGVHLLSLPFEEIRIDNEMPLKQIVSDRFVPHAAYIVVGGLTGLGWEMVQTLAQGGAGLIAIISRRGTSESRNAEIAAIEQQWGCSIICCKCDITDYAQVEMSFSHILSEAKHRGCITEGIFQGAGVLEGSLIQTLTEEKLSKPMKPKILGTLNLHIASKGYNLKHFVMHSSITSVLGNLGQCAYAAGNAFMDTFAHWRRCNNLNAISINWGALEVGMAARDDFTELFIKRGYLQLTREEIKECLCYALIHDQTGMTYTNINWETVAKDYSKPNMEHLRLKLEDILDDTKSAISPDNENDTEKYRIDWSLFESGDMKTKEGMLTWIVLAIANYVLPTASGKYTIRTPFAEIGMDSMTAVTFTDVVNDKTRVRIPLAYMLDLDRCLKDVVEYLLKELTGETCTIEGEDEIRHDLQSGNNEAAENMASISDNVAVTIPGTVEQQTHEKREPASHLNTDSDLQIMRQTNNASVENVQKNEYEKIAEGTHMNGIEETVTAYKASVEKGENKTPDHEIPENDVENNTKRLLSKGGETAEMGMYTDANKTRTNTEIVKVSSYAKSGRYGVDETKVIHENSETQYAASGVSAGTLENKQKEKWDDWIRRKAMADTSDRKLELNGTRANKDWKAGNRITFAPETIPASLVKSKEKWDEWIHRKATSVADRPPRSAKLLRSHKTVK